MQCIYEFYGLISLMFRFQFRIQNIFLKILWVLVVNNVFKFASDKFYKFKFYRTVKQNWGWLVLIIIKFSSFVRSAISNSFPYYWGFSMSLITVSKFSTNKYQFALENANSTESMQIISFVYTTNYWCLWSPIIVWILSLLIEMDI